MARTPLLRALERLAEEHHTAERLGIPPAELRGQRAEAEYSRGEFLKRAGVAGAGFAVVPGSRRLLRKPADTAPRIAIVGGGIAGLNAALILADKNVASTIYEARPTAIGGRMHSDRTGYWSNGQVSEWCGELIDSSHMTIRTSRSGSTSPPSTCSLRSPTAQPTRTSSSAATTRPATPTTTSRRSTRRCRARYRRRATRRRTTTTRRRA